MNSVLWAAISAGEGGACLQNFVLRLVLFQTKQIPQDFVVFFQQAEDRLFICYVFVHRYLQEHFANLSFDAT